MRASRVDGSSVPLSDTDSDEPAAAGPHLLGPGRHRHAEGVVVVEEAAPVRRGVAQVDGHRRLDGRRLRRRARSGCGRRSPAPRRPGPAARRAPPPRPARPPRSRAAAAVLSPTARVLRAHHRHRSWLVGQHCMPVARVVSPSQQGARTRRPVPPGLSPAGRASPASGRSAWSGSPRCRRRSPRPARPRRSARCSSTIASAPWWWRIISARKSRSASAPVAAASRARSASVAMPGIECDPWSVRLGLVASGGTAARARRATRPSPRSRAPARRRSAARGPSPAGR